MIDSISMKLTRGIRDWMPCFSCLDCGIILLDKEKQILAMNGMAQRMTSWQKDEERDEVLDEVVTLEKEYTQERLSLSLEDWQESETKRHYEHLLLKSSRNGFSLPVKLTLCSFWKQGAQVEAWMLQIQDQSSQKEFERIKKEFVQAAAHELRTPLTSIKAVIETLQQQKGLDQHKQDYLLHISKKEVDRLYHYIEELIEVTELETNALFFERSLFEVKKVLNNVLGAYRPMYTRKSIHVYYDVCEEDCVIYGDPTRLQRVFHPLIEHAVKCTPEEGMIAIYVGRKEQEVIVQIEYRGEGMAEDGVVDQLVGFSSSGMTEEGLQRGRGSGLDLVKRIVHLHNGEMEIQNQVDQGTRFTLRFAAYGEPD